MPLARGGIRGGALDWIYAVEIICNGRPRQVAEGLTIAGLLDELGLSPRLVAIEVNLELVPRGLHARRTLDHGDRLEVVSLVGGG